MEMKGVGTWSAAASLRVGAQEADWDRRTGRLGLVRRIPTDADDPRREGQLQRLRTETASIDEGRREAQVGRELAGAAGDVLGQLSHALGRLRSLAVRALGGGLSEADRASLVDEFDGLREQVEGLLDEAQHGDVDLFGGGELSLRAGDDAGEVVSLPLPDADSPAFRALAGLDLSSVAGAAVALDSVQLALDEAEGAAAEVAAADESLAGALRRTTRSYQRTALAVESLERADEAGGLARALAPELPRHEALGLRLHLGFDAEVVQRLLAR